MFFSVNDKEPYQQAINQRDKYCVLNYISNMLTDDPSFSTAKLYLHCDRYGLGQIEFLTFNNATHYF